jgi:UDP-N-acetylmuramoyl-tripeptide--D-alanyl-D-alanine ligase
MRALSLAEAVNFSGGRLHGTGSAAIVRVQIDSRALKPGDLFVCLRGERFDGHDFAAAAVGAGAAALLVERVLSIDLPQIVCVDTQRGLGLLAAGLAATRATRVIGITGSNGKTSVKTLLAGILAGVGDAYANPGNFNNEVGLPLSLLAQPEEARFGVFEMGAGQPGDIEWLAQLARPRYALVNNIGPAHLERLGSLLGIAEAKGAIYAALPEDGVAVINQDDAFAPLFAQIAGRRRVLSFGLEHGAAVSASGIQSDANASRFTLQTPAGAVALRLPLPGRHNVMNALAAAALALAAGVDLVHIAQGLERAEGVLGRLTARSHPSGAQIIDDSYNANPGSVAAAIQTLAQGGGEAWLVLGDMRELGPQAQELHAEIGRLARTTGIARLFTVGALAEAAASAFGEGAEHFATQPAMAEALRSQLRQGLRVLVKGSRGSRMEQVVVAVFDDVDGGGGHAA